MHRLTGHEGDDLVAGGWRGRAEGGGDGRVMEEKGVTHLAAICAICKSQFTKVFPYYGFDMFQIVSVHQLVSNAIVLNRKTAPEDAPGYGEDEDDDE